MILNLTPIFAAAEAQNPLDQLGVQPAPRNLIGMRATDMLLILTIAVVLSAVMIIWAVYFRKPKSDGSESRQYKSRPYVEERPDGTIRKRKKSKRLRRQHRQRNPTLAEVGGLPPLKSDTTLPPI